MRLKRRLLVYTTCMLVWLTLVSLFLIKYPTYRNKSIVVSNLSGIDFSGLNDSTLYKGDNGSDFVLAGDAIYMNKIEYVTTRYVNENGELRSAESHYESKGIFQINNGKLTLVCEDNITGLKGYGKFLYYTVPKKPWNDKWRFQQALYCLDPATGETVKIAEGMQNFTVCPSGVFWVFSEYDYLRNQHIQIKHANLDGTEIKTIVELRGYFYNGDVDVFHHSLYFDVTTQWRSDYFSSETYRLDLGTGILDKPEQLQYWKVNDNTTKKSKYQLLQPTNVLNKYDRPAYFIGADDGWLYFKTYAIWLDPATMYEEYLAEYRLYKTREDGTERTEIEFLVSPNIFSIQNGWIYYGRSSDNKIIRVKTDGSQTQIIIDGPYTYEDINGDYLFLSQTNRGEQRLFRIKTDGSGTIEQLY